MVFEIKLEGIARKSAALLITFSVVLLLTFAALASLIVGLLTDVRTSPARELLQTGVDYVPNSARVLARLADAEMREPGRDLLRIEARAEHAVQVSPWDYRQRMLLASIEEAKGDRAAAERSLREAVALAPNHTQVHWRLANLLLRQARLEQSVEHFAKATAANPSLLPSTLDLVWRVSGGKLTVMQAIAAGDPKSAFALAKFLLNQSRVPEAIKVFEDIDRDSRLTSPESAAFVNTLIANNRFEEARQVWLGIVAGDKQSEGIAPRISNGGFEFDVIKGFEQFDWTIARNEYAVASVDSGVARTGSRSLRIDFLGRDTTRLDGQVRQMILVSPGVRFRLECYVKTENLVSPEGPRVVVTDVTSSTEIASSDPIAPGSGDWRRVEFEFTAPPNARGVVVTIKRVPKFSFDQPTRGAVWFDDFLLTEKK
ncbi:MAG TPA: tetratricopeptide repeat protein [Blastocatellia bacterium]|nr:tetratricopeptide repeat protein [Blastocatellia bacterium]